MDTKPAVFTETAVAAATTTTTTASPSGSDSSLLEYESVNGRSRGRWTVGTLTYTTGGLVAVIVCLLIGDVGLSFRDRSYGNGFALLLRKFNASNTAFSFLMTFMPQGISMLLGPTISFKSDRLRSRWGRRIPFLFFAAPVGMLATIGIAFTPQLAHALHALLGPRSPGTTWCALIVFGFFWMFFQLSFACTNALMNGLINDVIPRPMLGRFFGLWRGLSLVCGMTFNFFILGHVESNFQLIFVAIALALGIGVTVMCLTVKEGEYPPIQDVTDVTDDFRAAGFIASLKIYFRDCFSKPYYLWVFFALALGVVTAMPVNTFSVWYAKSLKVDMDAYGNWLATNHVCGFLLAFPLGVLVDRYHTLRTSMITIAVYGITLLLGGIFIQGPRTLLWAVFFQALTSGMYLTTSLALAPTLLPRLKFAQFYSASLVLTSVVTMLAGLVLGFALDLSGSNYRLTYFVGFGLAMITLAVMAVVHRKFMALGGPKGYVAPDEVPATIGFPIVMPQQNRRDS